MLIFGAVDFTAALAKVAKVLGYRVIVCDAREIFATKRRFPMADEVVVTGPDPVFDGAGPTLGPRDAVCILTHDPKFDVPAIAGALATRVGYIGVMGSRKTHAKRMERLAEVGHRPAPSSTASWRRSASTSAPAHPRRPRSRSARRSSPCGPAARRRRSGTAPAPSTP